MNMPGMADMIAMMMSVPTMEMLTKQAILRFGPMRRVRNDRR
jgi:hypothetical protein